MDNPMLCNFTEAKEALSFEVSTNQFPVMWMEAKNDKVSIDGYGWLIDFTSGIFVSNCGHGRINEALTEYLKTQYTWGEINQVLYSYTFPTQIKGKFLRMLKATLPNFCEKVYLASAGSEVTSWAVNLMREYTKKKIIIHIDGSFHGKTGVIEKLNEEEIRLSFPTSEEQFTEDFAKILSYSGNPENGGLAGIMIESYQGWSARFMNKEYIQKLVKFGQDNDIPVCFDEIQGGFWRTGKLFAYEYYEVEPDLICLGKGLGGGMPISALTGREKYFNVKGMSSTHSGNALCCVGALEALNIYWNMNKEILKIKGEYLHNRLRKIQSENRFIKETYGKGLLGSLICINETIATEICEMALSNGLLLVKTGRESVKIGPPLTIEFENLIKGLNILEEVIKSC